MHKVVVERAPDKNGGPPRLAYVNLEFGLETSIGLRVGGAFVGRDHRRRAGVDAPTGDLGAALNLGVLQGNTADVALWTGRRVNCRRPHICRSTPAAALARRLSIHPACAFGVAQFSVARGARLTVASCFHTLVSAIRRPAGLRAGTVHAARRTAVRNRVGGRGSGCSARCARC